MDKVKCEKCSFNLRRPRSDICEECNQSQEPAGLLSKTVFRNKTPPKIMEHRLRVFHVDDTEDHQCPDQPKNSSKKCFKLESLSSSKAQLSFALSDTIIEEHWTETTLTSISLLRITSDSFEIHPLLIDPSHGEDITKISFEGPCSPKAISKALEYFHCNFPAIESIEFASGFFTQEDFYDQDDLSSSSPTAMHFSPTFKSLTVNCDVQKYFELDEFKQNLVHLRIVSFLNFASKGLTKNLTFCSLSLPNTSKLDQAVTTFIENSAGKGEKQVDYANAEIRYKVDSTTKPKNKPQIASRKRKADSSPEVEITEFSKEDKIQNVTLSSSSDDEQEQESEPDNDDEVNPHFLQRHSNEKCSPVQVADRLSSNSWRDVGGDHTGVRDSFDCTSIRIGDYECRSASGKVYRRMIFSDFGIYFQVPHYTDPNRTFVDIGIPNRDISEVKVHFGTSKSTIYLKLGLGTSGCIRSILGMHMIEERQGHYSPTSKNLCQQFIVFETSMYSKSTKELFKHLYRSKSLEELDPICQLHLLQIKTRCSHEDLMLLAGQQRNNAQRIGIHQVNNPAKPHNSSQ